MKILKLISWSLAALAAMTIFLSVMVHAEGNSVNINYNREENRLEIGGDADVMDGSQVTVQILNPEKQSEELENFVPENADDVFFYLGQTTAEEKKYNLKFEMDARKGDYLVRVYLQDNGEPMEKSFRYISDEELKSALEKINLAKTVDEAKAWVLEYAVDFGLNTELYRAMAEENVDMTEVYAGLLNKNFPDYKAIGKSFIKDCLKPGVDKLNNIAAAADALVNYGSYINLDKSEFFNIYCGFEKNYRERTVLGMKNDSKSSDDDFVKSFEKNTLLCYIQNSAVWSSAEAKLEKYADSDYLDGLSWSGFKALDAADRNSVISDILKNEYRDMKRFINDFNTSVDNKKQSRPESRPSGGGGGGGSTNIIAAPEKKDEVKNPQDKPVPDEEKEIFVDIDSAEWARESIEMLAEAGVISGRGEGIFAPGDSVTREEFIKMLVSGFDMKNDGGKSKFKDVSEEAWYYDYVLSAEQNKIVMGDENGFFGIGRKITRQDAAVMIMRVMKAVGAEPEYKNEKIVFADAGEISGYARESVENMQRMGFFSGYEDMSIKPLGNLTRAEAAKVLYDLLKTAGKI